MCHVCRYISVGTASKRRSMGREGAESGESGDSAESGESGERAAAEACTHTHTRTQDVCLCMRARLLLIFVRACLPPPKMCAGVCVSPPRVSPA